MRIDHGAFVHVSRRLTDSAATHAVISGMAQLTGIGTRIEADRETASGSTGWDVVPLPGAAERARLEL